jgi:hypothetical protein
MIWLLTHPLPPSPVSKLDRRYTERLRKIDNLLTGEGEGGGMGKESDHHTTARMPGPLLIIQYPLLYLSPASSNCGNDHVGIDVGTRHHHHLR